MDIYEELSKVKDDGLEMLEVLKRAKLEGHTQAEAIEALQKMYDETVAEEREADQDLICDVMDVAKNCCRPEFRIWPDSVSE